jgi:4'-phosphopantetheinyl transferase
MAFWQWLNQCVPKIDGISHERDGDAVDNASLIFQRITFENGSKPKPLIEIVSEEVHVWGFLLDVDVAELTHASHYLSGDEQERVNRLVSERHRQQFMVAHAVLRVVLSRYCGQRPQELVIQKTSAGKPFLTDSTAIRFNLTHSHGRALIAIAKDREVGIDLEKLRPEVDVVGLAKRFLSGQDQAFIEAAGPERRHERFLQVWVAREAVFKAAGKGITFPLHRDHVALSSDEKEGCLIRGEGGSEGTNMPIRFLPLEPGWVGAVAAEGTNWTVTYLDGKGELG